MLWILEKASVPARKSWCRSHQGFGFEERWKTARPCLVASPLPFFLQYSVRPSVAHACLVGLTPSHQHPAETHHLLVLGRQTHLNSKHHSRFLPKRNCGASASLPGTLAESASFRVQQATLVCLCRCLQHHQEEATWPPLEPPMQES